MGQSRGPVPDETLSPPADLQEMLREQERVIDHQVRAIEELDDKSEHMIRLSMAALAGGVGLASLLPRATEVTPLIALLPLGIAAGLNLAARIAFVDAYVGFREHAEAHIGPDPSWVARKAQADDWTLERHLLALIADHEGYSAHNGEVMEHTAARRRMGVYVLLASILAYAIGYIYILSGVMIA